jgi:hypothetical protein
MAKFDMRNQQVTYQYNADTINFDKVSNRTEFARQIDNMRAEISRASSERAGPDTNGKGAECTARGIR